MNKIPTVNILQEAIATVEIVPRGYVAVVAVFRVEVVATLRVVVATVAFAVVEKTDVMVCSVARVASFIDATEVATKTNHMHFVFEQCVTGTLLCLYELVHAEPERGN